MTGSALDDERTITPTVLPPIRWGRCGMGLVTYGARFFVNGNVQIVWGFKHIRDAWSWITQHSFLVLGESAAVVQGTDDSYTVISPSPGKRTTQRMVSTG